MTDEFYTKNEYDTKLMLKIPSKCIKEKIVDELKLKKEPCSLVLCVGYWAGVIEEVQ